MARPHGPKTIHGLALIDAGIPLRKAAARAGVADSTLVRARAGMPGLRKGRPKATSPKIL